MPDRLRSTNITASRLIEKRASTLHVLFTISIAARRRPPRIPQRWSRRQHHPPQAIDPHRAKSHRPGHREPQPIRSDSTLKSKKLLFSLAAALVFVVLLDYG